MRFRAQDIDNEVYYQLPKSLFSYKFYEGLDIKAKVLYAVLKDRMNLSRKNGWVEANGDIFLMFSYGDEETDGVSDIAKRIDLAVQSGKGYVRITAGKDANVRVSTLNGMQMAKEQMYEGDTRTINLPSGIYIINGMKIIVK